MTPEEATRSWLEGFVVKLGLCPFAAAPLEAGRVRIARAGSADPHEILADLLHEVARLDRDEAETTLLVVPEGLSEFDEFLAISAAAEDLLELKGHADRYQLATFHPDYVFDGEPADDPAHATNRSPHPVLHLLRRASVAAAIESHPDPEGIPGRNIELLRSMATG